MLSLSDDDVSSVLSMEEAVEVNRAAFLSLATGDATVPERVVLPVPAHSGSTLFKPAFVPGHGLGLKVVSVRPANAAAGLPTVPAVVLLVDEATGVPTATVAATYLTALRTAAGSAVATDQLALKGASRLCVFGAGMQGRAHIEAVLCVRPIKHVAIWNRTRARADNLARELAAEHPAVVFDVVASPDDIDAAVAAADVIVTATNSSSPVFDGRKLRAGAHINAVGSYLPTMQELDSATLERCDRVIADNAVEVALIGDIAVPKAESKIVGELGGLLAGKVAGREHDQEITLFESVGTAVQDIATAAEAVRRYRARFPSAP